MGRSPSANITLAFAVSIFLVIVTIISWNALERIEAQARKDSVNTLQTILFTTQEAVQIWAHDRKHEAKLWAIAPMLIKSVQKLIALPRTREFLVDHRAQEDISEFFESVTQTHEFQSVYIMTSDYVNLASLHGESVGEVNYAIKERIPSLPDVFEGKMLFIPPIVLKVSAEGSPMKIDMDKQIMSVAVPIKDSGGRSIAALVMSFDPTFDLSFIALLGRIGDSGETYFFDKYGRLLTESRFMPDLIKAKLVEPGENSFLNVEIRDPGLNLAQGGFTSIPRKDQPLTHMAKMAVSGVNGSSATGYRDYRGVTVLGAWTWEESLNIGMVTEIDAEEALKGYYETRSIIITVLAMTVALALLLSAFLVFIRARAARDLGESEKKYRKLFEDASDMVAIIDAETRFIVDANASAAQAHGYELKEFIGLSVGDIESRDSNLNGEPGMRRLAEGETVTFEQTNRRKNGSHLQVEISASRFWLGGRQVILALGRDITIRKRNENELLKARDQAEEATKLKDKFVSLVAHDIRSPLSSINGFLDALGGPSGMSPVRREVLTGRMKAIVGDLLKMSEDLLSLSRFSSGSVKLSKTFFSANIIVGQIDRDLSETANEKGVTIFNEVPPNARLCGDPSLFREVMRNLMNNAVKFCGKGDSITVFIPEGQPSTIAVKDTGTGIGEALLPVIFRQEEKTTIPGTAGEKGSGLGLPISFDIMQAHGGTITVESEEGKGSVFYAKLPEVKPLVLVVDDDDNFRLFLTESLKEFDVDVIEAQSGSIASDLLNTNTPNMVITDLSMPDGDGYELLENMKSRKELRKVLSVVVTSFSDGEAREKAFSCGANYFCAKPKIESEFLPRISMMLENSAFVN